MITRTLIYCFIIFSTLSSSFAQNYTDSTTIANTEISILTCRSGDELYSTFGHTAIRIKNSKKDFDSVYNYGLFSFDTPNFYMKFMRGQLPYLLGKTKMHYFLREYQAEKRSVIEQKLILSNDKKKSIISFLENNVKPENRAYAYDFFYDNCATRVVDVYDIYGQPGKEITYTNPLEDKTFRDLLKENLKNLPWSDFGIDIVIGARADSKTTRRHQMFLPEYLMKNLAHAEIELDGKPTKIAEDRTVILDFENENEKRKSRSTNWPVIITGLLFAVTIIVNISKSRLTHFYNKTLISISGILGLFLLFMWFGTNHGATRDNWNIMWFNPLLLLIAWTSLRNNNILKYIILALLLISGTNCLVSFLPQFMNLAFLPIIASIGIATWNIGDKSIA